MCLSTRFGNLTEHTHWEKWKILALDLLGKVFMVFTVCADLTPLLYDRPSHSSYRALLAIVITFPQWPGECAWSCLLWKWRKWLRQVLFTVVFEGVERVTTLLLLVLVMDVRVWRRKMHLTPDLAQQVVSLTWACMQTSRRQLLQLEVEFVQHFWRLLWKTMQSWRINFASIAQTVPHTAAFNVRPGLIIVINTFLRHTVP